MKSLDSSVGKSEAEALVNRDVIRIIQNDGQFFWDRDFSLPGLIEVATNYEETQVENGVSNISQASTKYKYVLRINRILRRRFSHIIITVLKLLSAKPPKLLYYIPQLGSNLKISYYC